MAGNSDKRCVGQVMFLGTGDPVNEERAQTCLALPLASDETMLIDVSGGIDVLRRLTAAGIPLRKVRRLFVTHRHFDHTGGLAPFLVALTPLRGAGLTVHALPETLGALREMLALTIPGVEDWMGERLRWGPRGAALRGGSRRRVRRFPHRAWRFDRGLRSRHPALRERRLIRQRCGPPHPRGIRSRRRCQTGSRLRTLHRHRGWRNRPSRRGEAPPSHPHPGEPIRRSGSSGEGSRSRFRQPGGGGEGSRHLRLLSRSATRRRR
jgi:hypothetical protein